MIELVFKHTFKLREAKFKSCDCKQMYTCLMTHTQQDPINFFSCIKSHSISQHLYYIYIHMTVNHERNLYHDIMDTTGYGNFIFTYMTNVQIAKVFFS